MNDQRYEVLITRLAKAEHALRAIKTLVYKEMGGVQIDPQVYMELAKKGLGEDE